MDKYYTKRDILDKVKYKIKSININGDKIIDFSCGDNYLCQNLFIDYGMEYVAYDIDPCENHIGKVIVKDFLKVKPHDIEKCIIVLYILSGILFKSKRLVGNLNSLPF